MSATVSTREIFDASILEENLNMEVSLRVKAGAIRSTYEKVGDEWILITEWNVIGEQ